MRWNTVGQSAARVPWVVKEDNEANVETALKANVVSAKTVAGTITLNLYLNPSAKL